jgi:hypothetical protein
MKPDEELLLTFSDVRSIWRKSRWKIAVGGLITAFIAGLIIALTPVQYSARGSFYEKGKGDQVTPDLFSAALLKGDLKERPAKVAFKSHKILEDAIQKLDLQAKITPETGRPIVVDKLLARIGAIPQNLMVEYAYLSQQITPALEDPKPEIVVRQINYKGEIPLRWQVIIQPNDAFLVKERSTGTLLGTGRFGTPFQNGSANIVLLRTSNADLSHEEYRLAINPLNDLADKLITKLHITNDYDTKSFFSLSILQPSRRGARDLLNAILDGYRDHLLTEHHRLVASQVEYLKKRQKDIDKQTAKLIQEQAVQLSNSGGNLELLVSSQQALTRRLLAIDLKLKLLNKAIEGNAFGFINNENDPQLTAVLGIVNRLQQDRLEFDALSLVVGGNAKLEQQETDRLLADLGEAGVAENDIQKNRKLDYELAKQLCLACSEELHLAEAECRKCSHAIKDIQNPDFELTALAAILKDNVSQQIIGASNTASIALKDKHNYTTREIERLEQELALNKNIISAHISQAMELLSDRQNLLSKNIRQLQQVMQQQLQQRIALEEKHLNDYLTTSIDLLGVEQQSILQQQEELQIELAKRPQQWVTEKLVELHLEANGTVMQQLGGLIESKNIADNLETTLSAPFDRAAIPLHPNPPHLWLFILVGAFAGAFLTFCWILIKTVSKGIFATGENLALSGQNVAGNMTSFDNERSTLRRLIAQLCPGAESKGSMLLMVGKGRDYASSLAELLVKRGQRVLIAPISFDVSADEKNLPGLLQCLEEPNVSPKISSCGSYDYIASGGTTQFGNELIQSEKYNQLINKLSKNYDWILAVSRVEPSSAEADSLLQIFDRIAITVCHERLFELSKFFEQKGKDITFVVE